MEQPPDIGKLNDKDRKLDFLMKKKLFDTAPPTIESLLDERIQLYQRLQISRDELDSYIRYMQTVCDEKTNISDELSGAKTNNEMLTIKCKRLENQNKLLVKECNDLMNMLADFGPKELYTYDRTSPTTEEAIINKIRESVQVIFNENGKLHQSQDLLKNEIRTLTLNLNESQKKVNELNKKTKYLEEELKNEKSCLTKSLNDGLSPDNKSSELSFKCKNLNSTTIMGYENVSIEPNERFYSVESSTPPSFRVAASGDNSSMPSSSSANNYKNSFNIDVFNEYPYKLKSCEVYSDSDGREVVDDTSLYKSTLENNDQNNSTLYDSCVQRDDNGENSSKQSKLFESAIEELEIRRTRSVSRNSTLDSPVDIIDLTASIKELHQITKSFFTQVDIFEKDDIDDEDSDISHNLQQQQEIPSLNLEEILSSTNATSITSNQKAYENLTSSIDILKNNLLLISGLLTKMSSDCINIRDENDMLAKEITALKYALTCRIELKNSRTTTTPDPVKKCMCNEKSADFELQKQQLNETINNLNKKIEELSDERSNLFTLITKIANSSDSGNE